MADPHADDGGLDRPVTLRASRPPVVRLSRRVLIGGAAVCALAGAGVITWGMLARPSEPVTGDQVAAAAAPPERLNDLPRDYAARDVPKLGPPLPGDLGRPILASRNSLPVSPGSPAPANAPTQNVAGQEREAARTSHLFGITGQAAAIVSDGGAGSLSIPAVAAATPPTGSSGLGAFLDSPPDRRTASPDRVTAPVSPFTLQAGAVIPGALVTGIRSDLPGQVSAQVTQDVFDSVTGQYLLIPAGARLLGHYDSQVTYGQMRVLLAWTRLILPNGRSIVLENLPATDPSGFSGLQDQVDHHWRTLLTAAAVTSLLSVGTEVESTGSENDLATALRRAGADSANQVGQQVVGRAVSIPPTLTIRPGMAVRVILTRDLVLEPYRS